MIENKVTSMYSPYPITDSEIQAHMDEQNALGFYLLSVDNLVGWYRFFWAKNVE